MFRMRSSKRKDKEQQEEGKENSSSTTIPLGAVAYSKWAGRFTWTAIIQGAIVALLTAMLAAFVATTGYPILLVQAMLSIPQVGFSEITALAGLGLYLIVGVIGTGLTAQFYHHFEIRAGKPYKGMVTSGLAWTHLVLMNLGIAAASLLMIYAGYLGDIAVGEKEAGGFGMTIEQVSQQILNQFIVPVSSLLLITVVGAIAGGAGFIINQFQRQDIQTQEIGGKRRA
jgi:hypothetical protein